MKIDSLSNVKYIALETEYIGEDIFASTNEVPVNFFTKADDAFNGVANSWKYKEGDGRFTVFGHGAPGYILDQTTAEGISTGTKFDKYMSLHNSKWDEAKDKNGTTLTLLSCQSATMSWTGCTLAQVISVAHPNILVIGADGFVEYSQSFWSRKYTISGINTESGSGKNDGYLVAYRNGKEIYRERFNK